MGVFLDDGAEGILLPKRYMPEGLKIGDDLTVFLYHDSEDRPIATTEKPLGILGDIVKLKAVNLTEHGAFLDWGLMKDIFVPKTKMVNFMRPGGEYLVKIIMDDRTGRLVATEKIEPYLTNENLQVVVNDEVSLIVYRRTEIGYEVIINKQHKGMLHFNEIYRDIQIGDAFPGFIKNINSDESKSKTLIDVVAGKMGYERVGDEAGKVLDLLREHDGYLPYNDKSSPEDIYSFFAMSKKTFKMATGKLYKAKKINFTKTGIQLVEEL